MFSVYTNTGYDYVCYPPYLGFDSVIGFRRAHYDYNFTSEITLYHDYNLVFLRIGSLASYSQVDPQLI